MPHRAYHLALGIAGLIAVAVLALAGANLLRHSRSGATWKQRLISAGLLLLGALGFGGLAGCPKKDSPATTGGEIASPDNKPHNKPHNKPDDKPHKQPHRTPGTPATPDEQAPPAGGGDERLGRIAMVTAEARAVADGKRGQYPFDRAGKQRLLASLDAAQRDVDGLQAAGRINEGEAGLWKEDLKQLATGVRAFRPTEMKLATCYEPMPAPVPKRKSLRRLLARLKPLAKLARADRLDPAVTRKVLVQIEADLAVLTGPGGTQRLQPDEAQKITRLTPRIQRLLAQIRAKLDAARPDPALDASAQWRRVKEAWRFIAPLAANSSGSTTAQREEAAAKLKGALAALDQLVAQGKLVAAEAQLLRDEAERLQWKMRRSPPADRRVKCYKQKVFIPAEASLERIAKRLPLLEQLAAANKLSPGVMSRVLPTLERDALILSSPDEVDRLLDAKKPQAPAAARRARAVLKRIRRLMQQK